jgi:hypothetical protein
LGPEAGSLLLESWKVLGLTRELGALNISLRGQVTFKNRHLGLLGETSLGTLGDTWGYFRTILDNQQNNTSFHFTAVSFTSLHFTSLQTFTIHWISKLNTTNTFSLT